MSRNLKANIQVKQKLWAKIIFKTIFFMGRIRLVSLSKALPAINYLLQKGAFKFRVDKGEWKTLDNVGEIEIE